MTLKASPILSWSRTLSDGDCPCGSGYPAKKCCWLTFNRWRKQPSQLTQRAETGVSNGRCYLHPLGGCSTKITREHFVSRNILERLAEGKLLRLQNGGHLFGGKDNLEIGIDSFTAKVLCDNHNSLLSDLDTAAGRAFSDLEKAVPDLASDANASRLILNSGIDLERWLTKVYCGLTAAGAIRGQSGEIKATATISHLLRSVAGLELLPKPLGLYFHHEPGLKLTASSMKFGTLKLTDGSDDVGGLILSLGLMSLVLVASTKYCPGGFYDSNWHRHVITPIKINNRLKKVFWVCTFDDEL
ncbi:hypothetical protein [Bradyrhizobium sp. 174]|uniref:hypothetical protein n=1 Tax=Bradyrhizobium sp. 174 TaxID=2782645 RepID=UPI001FF74DDB|nr:hypothetical protein [Bradyrhizobium sp. 174]MCK1577795.1 hypothetical protein [Bradyrhizobium sp. 174]